MNERIRELAKQSGDDWDHTLESDKEFLKKFDELIVAKERKACAKMCEYLDAEYEGEDVLGTW